jgi:uncharacterized protein YbcI
VTPPDPEQSGDPSVSSGGEIVATISRRLVQLLKEYYGKGPTRAKTYYQDDVVLVLLRGGFTRVEETLRQEGQGGAVIEQRMRFQDVMAERFTEVVEEATGRKVVAFMSGSYQQPDIISELFVLEPKEPGKDILHDAQAGDGD